RSGLTQQEAELGPVLRGQSLRGQSLLRGCGSFGLCRGLGLGALFGFLTAAEPQPAALGLLLGLLLCGEVDELEVRHLGSVSRTWPDADDAGVAARAVLEARGDVGEERVHDLLRA